MEEISAAVLFIVLLLLLLLLVQAIIGLHKTVKRAVQLSLAGLCRALE